MVMLVFYLLLSLAASLVSSNSMWAKLHNSLMMLLRIRKCIASRLHRNLLPFTYQYRLCPSASSACLHTPVLPHPSTTPPRLPLPHLQSSAMLQGDAKKAVQDEVMKTLKTHSGFGDQLLEQMAHAHPTPGSANDNSAQR